MEYRLRVRRYDPDVGGEARWQDYAVEADPDERVLDALVKIKQEQDGTLTFRSSCAHGVCGSDGMTINGKSRLGCRILLKEAARESDPITVGPLPGYPVIKDLVIDQELFLARYRALQPYLVAKEQGGAAEARQSPEAWQRYEYTSRCILCGICTSSCPTFWANKEYVGPAAIVQTHRFLFDDRDGATEERLEHMRESGGVFACRSIYNCSEACPRRIEIVRAIAEVKRAARKPRRRARRVSW